MVFIKKMVFAIVSIIAITLIFLLFSCDINAKNEKFLKRFGIIINPSPVSFEEITIPYEFDSVYQNYNFLQIQSGFDLSLYKGRSAVRYTYEILNFPEDRRVFANLICVNNKAVGGDIACMDLDGFMLPLNYLKGN